MTTTDWRKCNICKKSISFGQKFWICNVSTCNRRRTWLRFCSVDCYDAHLPGLNHRESWAQEEKAPSAEVWSQYVGKEGEDAVWPPQVKAKAKDEEAPAPHQNAFGGNKGAQPAPVIRRRKTE